MNDEAVWRTAPATAGLLVISYSYNGFIRINVYFGSCCLNVLISKFLIVFVIKVAVSFTLWL